MIFIINEKVWKKRAKKLVEAKDYIIFDATDDETGSLTKYSNVVSMGDLNPPSKLVKAKLSKDEHIMDKGKLKKMEKKFFNSKSFRVSSMALVKGFVQADGDINLFVVLKNKSYRAYAKKIRKQIMKLFDVKNMEFIFLYTDIEMNKKILKKKLNNKSVKTLSDKLLSLEKKMDK